MSQNASLRAIGTNTDTVSIKPSTVSKKTSTTIGNIHITTLIDSSNTDSSQPDGSNQSISTQTVISEVNKNKKTCLAVITQVNNSAFNYATGAELNNTIQSPEKQSLISQEHTVSIIDTNTLKPGEHIIQNFPLYKSQMEKDTTTPPSKRNVIIGCLISAAFSLLTIILTLVYVKFGKGR